MVYVVMGVSGSGKTTIGRILAEKLSTKFYDADDFHMKRRRNHFFSPELLDSQFNALEAPSGTITIQTDKPPEDICKEIVARLPLF